MTTGDTVNQFLFFRQSDVGVAYSAGAAIFSAGDPADCLYVVRSGRVALRAGDATLEELEEGGMFGEMALVDTGARSASAIAVTDCEVVPVDLQRFRRLVHQHPYFAENVMKVMAERLRRATPQA